MRSRWLSNGSATLSSRIRSCRTTRRSAKESGQLPGLNFMRTLWLCEQAGGPFKYTGKELDEAHKHLHITPEEFDEVGAEIGRALEDLGVPEQEKQEVLAAIVAHQAEVVSP